MRLARTDGGWEHRDFLVEMSRDEMDYLVQNLSLALQSDTMDPTEGDDPRQILDEWYRHRPDYIAHGVDNEGHTEECAKQQLASNDVVAAFLERLLLMLPRNSAA